MAAAPLILVVVRARSLVRTGTGLTPPTHRNSNRPGYSPVPKSESERGAVPSEHLKPSSRRGRRPLFHSQLSSSSPIQTDKIFGEPILTMSSIDRITVEEANERWTKSCTAVLQMDEAGVKDVEWAQRVEGEFVST